MLGIVWHNKYARNYFIAEKGSITIPSIWPFQSKAPHYYQFPQEIFLMRSLARLRSPSFEHSKAKPRAFTSSLMKSFHCEARRDYDPRRVIILKRNPAQFPMSLMKSFHCDTPLDYEHFVWSFLSESPAGLRFPS